MSNLKLQWLADELRAAGLDVVEHSGWKTRTAPKSYEYIPTGLLNHHTAGSSVLYNYPNPPYWSNTRLEYSCNITIRPNGQVCVLNAGVANDSGMGDPNVLARMRRDEPPKPPVDFDSEDRVSGNPWFIDIEVQHLGDGSYIHAPQRAALIETNAVICRHYDWNPLTRLIGHREWTLRKIDPRWAGFSNPMPGIRADTIEAMEDALTPGQEAKLDAILKSLNELPIAIWGAQPGGPNEASAWQTLIRTRAGVAALSASAIGGAVVTEIAQRLMS